MDQSHTAFGPASDDDIVLYEDEGLRFAIRKQKLLSPPALVFYSEHASTPPWGVDPYTSSIYINFAVIPALRDYLNEHYPKEVAEE